MYKEKAEAYLREKLPELSSDYKDELYTYVRNGAGKDSYGDVCDYVDENPQWIPLQFQHWLRVIGSKEQVSSNLTAVASNGCMYKNGIVVMQFNLTTGQPATEEDYQAFCEIVGILESDKTKI